MKIQKTFKKPGGRNLVRQKSKSKNKSGWQDSNLRPSRTAAGRDSGLRSPPETKKPTNNLLVLSNFK